MENSDIDLINYHICVIDIDIERAEKMLNVNSMFKETLPFTYYVDEHYKWSELLVLLKEIRYCYFCLKNKK